MNRFAITKKVAVLGISSNLVLLILKLIVGFISRSQAMIADGLNSAGDLFASFMTLIGNRIASRPEDDDHPYGHGKAEYIFSMIISFSLLFVAYKIFSSSLKSIIHKEVIVYSFWLMAIAVFTIVVKACLYVFVNRAGKKENSLLILANAEDHRNDVFVTSSTLLGIYLSKKGYFWADGAVGICISLWIAFTGIRIFLSSYHVLMDRSFDAILESSIADAIQSVEGVDHIDSLTAKPVGAGYIIIVKVSVHGDMKVHEGHSIAAKIRAKVRIYKQIKDVVVHINPA